MNALATAVAQAELATTRLGVGIGLAAVARDGLAMALALEALGDAIGHECVLNSPTTRALALIASDLLIDRPHCALARHAARAIAIAPEADC